MLLAAPIHILAPGLSLVPKLSCRDADPGKTTNQSLDSMTSGLTTGIPKLRRGLRTADPRECAGGLSHSGTY